MNMKRNHIRYTTASETASDRRLPRPINVHRLCGSFLGECLDELRRVQHKPVSRLPIRIWAGASSRSEVQARGHGRRRMAHIAEGEARVPD
jgi:hypothetical protein